MVMGIRGVGALALALLLTACGGGSGRQGSDLVVSGTGPSSQLAAGDAANFTMTVKNAGENDASDVTISNHVVGLLLSGTTCSASGGATCPSTLTGTMSVGDMPAGSSLTFQVASTVPQSGAGAVTIEDTMTADYSEEVDRTNNTATVTGSAYIANAAITVTGTAPVGLVTAGSATSFSFIVANAGPDAAQTVKITSSVSNNAHGTTITCTASGGAACPTSTVSPITVDQLPSGGSLVFAVNTTVDSDTNGQVEATLTAKSSSTYDPDSSDNTLILNATASTATNLAVQQSVPPSVPAGQSAQFIATIQNGSTSSLSNVVVTETVSPATAIDSTKGGVTVACSSSPVGQCPAAPLLSGSITIPTLRPQAVLTLTYSVPLIASARGTVTNSVTATAGSVTSSDNTPTQAVDASSGTYQVFGADGTQYQLTLDFDAGTYSFANSAGQELTGESGSVAIVNNGNSADPANGDYLLDGNAGRRMRVGSDLIVGEYPLGGGSIVPFIAARQFLTRSSAISNLGNFDLATLDTASGGTRTTHAGTANFSSTLVICQSDTGVDRVTNCPGPVKSYSLLAPATGDVSFTATNTAQSTDTFNFVIAQTNTLTVLVSALVDSSGNRELRIGVPDAVALTTGGFNGPSTSGDWVHMDITGTSYGDTVINGSGSSHSASLTPINPSAGPFSMLQGSLDANVSSPVFVLEAYPLAVVVGDFNGNQNGLFELGLP
jgi:hypothetical protein